MGRNDVSNWVDLVVQEARQRLANGRALLLAQIPAVLRKHGLNLEEILANRTLRTALHIDGNEKLLMIQDPDNRLVWGVVPKSDPLPNDIRPLFNRSQQDRVPIPPRFRRAFWTAFIKPIPADHKRYILTQGSHFSDIPNSQPPPLDAIEVKPEDVVQPDLLSSALKDDAILAAVRRWTAREGLTLSDFYSTQSLSSPRADTRSPAFPAFHSLDQDDLKRIMVPMDIVVKLWPRKQ
jgi:hypothetical protein